MRALLEREPTVQLQHVFDSVSSVSVPQPPRVAVFDVGVPSARSLDDVKLLSAKLPGTRLVGLSRCIHRRQCDALRASGLRAWLVDNSHASELPRAIAAVARDEAWRPPVLPETTLELSPREEEVLRLLAEGLTSKEMANKLEVALSTVETYRKQLMSKLSLHSIAALTRFAVRSGLVSLE
ncbi:MAG: response regulator transcription factor [Myxococcota bacterium]